MVDSPEISAHSFKASLYLNCYVVFPSMKFYADTVSRATYWFHNLFQQIPADMYNCKRPPGQRRLLHFGKGLESNHPHLFEMKKVLDILFVYYYTYLLFCFCLLYILYVNVEA